VSRSHRTPFPVSLLRFWFLRTLPVWCGTALVIFLMQLAVCGIVHDNQNVRQFLQFIDMLPSIVKTALGGEMLQVGNTPGLIAIGYNHPLVLFLYMFFAVAIPTGLLTGEVQRGTMELILSRPATRMQVYICAAILTIAGMFALVLVMFLGTVTATRIYDFGEPINLGLFFRIAINGGLLASAVGAISLLSASVFRRRNTAVGAPVAFLVLNYFIYIIGQWWPRMKFLEPATLFHYVDGPKLYRGWPLDDISVLIALLIVATAAGAVIWNRRDLPL
jgi:ABC-2 type transport system permease protein